MFAICWSLGASCDKAGRVMFDRFIRDRMKELTGVQPPLQHLPASAMMPDNASVYDWCFDQQVSLILLASAKVQSATGSPSGHEARHGPCLLT